jgi:hypothetical protein
MEIEILKPDDLKSLLTSFNIPFEHWGRKDDTLNGALLSRPFEYLYREAEIGASRFIVKDRILIRFISIVDLRVFEPVNGSTWHQIVQISREDASGNERYWQVKRGITTKVRRDEMVMDAARRALLVKAKYKGVIRDIHPESNRPLAPYLSRSFPGLKCAGIDYVLVCEIPKGHLNRRFEMVHERPDGGKSNFRRRPVQFEALPRAIRENHEQRRNLQKLI